MTNIFTNAQRSIGRMLDNLLIHRRNIPLSALAQFLVSPDGIGSNGSFESVVNQGYKKNPYVNACMRKLIESSWAVKFKLTKDGEEISPADYDKNQSALVELLKQPNPDQDITEFIEEWLMHLHFAGVAYIQKLGVGTQSLGGGQVPRTLGELQLLRPDSVEVLSSNGRITGFRVTDDKGKPEMLEPVDVMMSRFVDPVNKNVGYAPVRAANIVIETFNNGVIWNNTLMKNMGLVSGIAVISGIRNLKKEGKDKLESDFADSYTGLKNIGKVKVMAADGMTYVQMGHTTKDLDWMGGKRDLMRDICAVMGMPSQLFNDPGASTYSNYQEAMKALYQNKTLPTMRMFITVLNLGLVPSYDANTEIILDISNIDALKDNENDHVARLVKRQAWSTVNEIRKLDGLPEIADGDVLLVAMNLTPLSDIAGGLAEPEPDEPDDNDNDNESEGDDE